MPVFLQLPGASRNRLISQIKDLPSTSHDPFVISDTTSVVIAKLEAEYLSPTPQRYLASNYFTYRGWLSRSPVGIFADLVRLDYQRGSQALLNRWYRLQKPETFDLSQRRRE